MRLQQPAADPLSEECGPDWTDLHECLESRHYEEAVMGQFQEAVNLGITGIPGLIIGNILFTGARPYGIFKAATDKVLEDQIGVEAGGSP